MNKKIVFVLTAFVMCFPLYGEWEQQKSLSIPFWAESNPFADGLTNILDYESGLSFLSMGYRELLSNDPQKSYDIQSVGIANGTLLVAYGIDKQVWAFKDGWRKLLYRFDDYIQEIIIVDSYKYYVVTVDNFANLRVHHGEPPILPDELCFTIFECKLSQAEAKKITQIKVKPSRSNGFGLKINLLKSNEGSIEGITVFDGKQSLVIGDSNNHHAPLVSNNEYKFLKIGNATWGVNSSEIVNLGDNAKSEHHLPITEALEIVNYNHRPLAFLLGRDNHIYMFYLDTCEILSRIKFESKKQVHLWTICSKLGRLALSSWGTRSIKIYDFSGELIQVLDELPGSSNHVSSIKFTAQDTIMAFYRCDLKHKILAFKNCVFTEHLSAYGAVDELVIYRSTASIKKD